MLASLLRIILLTATLKILERGLDKGPIIVVVCVVWWFIMVVVIVVQNKLLSRIRHSLDNTTLKSIYLLYHVVKEIKRKTIRIRRHKGYKTIALTE